MAGKVPVNFDYGAAAPKILCKFSEAKHYATLAGNGLRYLRTENLCLTAPEKQKKNTKFSFNKIRKYDISSIRKRKSPDSKNVRAAILDYESLFYRSGIVFGLLLVFIFYANLNEGAGRDCIRKIFHQNLDDIFNIVETDIFN